MLGLSKSAQRLQSALRRRLVATRISDSMREDIEEALLEADLGYETASELASALHGKGFRDASDLAELQTTLITLVAKKLRACEVEESSLGVKGDDKGVLVVVLLGTNGCGKTSSAGKLAARFQAQDAKVLLAAGDTFRAAATEQLQAWATRTKTEMITGARQSDPAALAFQALALAREKAYDILLFDTAGRQDSDTNLMQQIAKIERALLKQTHEAKQKQHSPRIEFWLVLDATLGQSLVLQAKRFAEVVPVRRLLLTKLDSSARAGAVVSLAREKKPTPVQYLATGEGLRDLVPFRAQDFAEGLIDLNPNITPSLDSSR